MPDTSNDEFYIGYSPKAPVHTAKHTLLVIVVHLVLSMAGAALVIAGMRDPGDGTWETGQPVVVQGVLVKDPFPALVVPETRTTILLVNFGKQGAQGRLAMLEEGTQVEVAGYPLRRGGADMLEILPDVEPKAIGVATEGAPASWNGDSRTFRGEIVDSKCYLGAMKPGDGKAHKACAARCISGGIPPVLVCWHADGPPDLFMLASSTGGPPGEWILPLVGESVEVTGEMGQMGSLRLLRVTPGGIRR